MQYSAPQVHTPVDQPLPLHKLRYPAIVAAAAAVSYGLSSHHIMLVALIVGAVWLLVDRIRSSGRQAVMAQGHGRILQADGGSFPGSAPHSAQVSVPTRPVMDGGSMEHHNSRATDDTTAPFAER